MIAQSSYSNGYIINGFIILIFSFLLGYLVKLVFNDVLKRYFKRTKTLFDDKIIQYVNNPVFWTVILGGIRFFILTLPLSKALSDILSNTVFTVAIVIWSVASIQILRLTLKELDKKYAKGEKIGDALPFLDNLTVIAVVGIAFLIGLDVWGINITPFLASAGIVGIAAAFAAKDSASNLFGGISVFLDKPYKIGDYVIIEERYRGEVTEIGMRSTKIRTRDNVLISIPNAVMVTNAVINETGFDPKLRIRIPVGIAYGSDLEKVEYVLINVLKAHKMVLNDPAPRIRFRKFGESSIDLEALATIDKPAHKGIAIHELIKEIDKAFKEEKITIPFPQTDVHLHK